MVSRELLDDLGIGYSVSSLDFSCVNKVLT